MKLSDEELAKCSRCFTVKPLSAYYNDKNRPSGKRTECKACITERTRKYRAANKEKMAAYGARWAAAHAEERRASHRAHQERNRAKIRRRNAEARASHPLQAAARSAVKSARRAGRLVTPQNCERCGGNVPLHAHHEDYAKPLDVVWLCIPCHRARHVELNQQRKAS